MSQQQILAAMRTWEGEINWAHIVQQRMYAEIESKRAEGTKSLELFSAFYISVCCEVLPPPAMFLGGPSSPRLTPSPLSSPEATPPSVAENRWLRERVQVYGR